MSHERRKMNKSCTGTVPKIKHRKNTFTCTVNDELSRSTFNSTHWPHSDYSNRIQNPRSSSSNYIMDTILGEEKVSDIQDEDANITENCSLQSTTLCNSNSSAKCDNVIKCPDKKQVEEKLNQIREYLKITNSLMSNMKNNDDQIFFNDGDELSEQSCLSGRRPEVDINLDARVESVLPKEQEMTFLKLQQKAEKRLREARQSNVLNPQIAGNVRNIKDSNNYQQFDKDIRVLGERAKKLETFDTNLQNLPDAILAKVESLHKQIMVMHNANDEREELIEALDNRDAELKCQHEELQNKLAELQNKKTQVDQLVTQLQQFGNDEDDVGIQVRKIVTMKDQLKKLKDMLELVKTTETVMQNTNTSAEAQAIACEICTTAENFLEKEFDKPKIHSSIQNDTNVLRFDNYSSADAIPKQFNKNSKKQLGNGAYPKTNPKISTQAALESKKRELEDLMGKHKASISNLNHDVGLDVKSEYSSVSNTINDAWNTPIIQQVSTDSDRFSSDEYADEINHYEEINENMNPLTVSGSCRSLNSKSTPTNITHTEPRQYVEPENSGTSARNVRANSAAPSNCVREQSRSNSCQKMKNQVQKQLQFIKSVCDSMLEEQESIPHHLNQNVQHVRNNLTPSTLYSEPQRLATPIAQPFNMPIPVTDMPWFSCNAELNKYQTWLTTNTMQTQTFMLNTLNQCCQMLSLQQRELASLRNTVLMIQERMENHFCGRPDHLQSSLFTTTQENCTTNQFHVSPNQKVNHVSAAYSLPNLNQCNVNPINTEANYSTTSNNHNSRILCPGINNININHLNAHSVDNPNNDLHGVNDNINHNLPNQIWNGQALNNQVAPGNRANNYWDNFRSYSRQNLLSTKNREVLQNCHSSLERSEGPNIAAERVNPLTPTPFSKSNSDQDSTNTSLENTPHRRGVFPRHEKIRIEPDLPDINQHQHNSSGTMDLTCMSNCNQQEEINDDVIYRERTPLNIKEVATYTSKIPDEQSMTKQCDLNEQERMSPNSDVSNSKLFEDLRGNIYKEVVSLISANESRPQFLIQLFRDLQMIGSDTLRLKILQSIQIIVTHSLLNSDLSNVLSPDSDQNKELEETLQDNFSMQSTLWSKPTEPVLNNLKISDMTQFQNIFDGALVFLNLHEAEVIQKSFLSSFKQILLNSKSFQQTVKDTIFQKHFSNIIDEILEQYIGKKVKDVKENLLQDINELICGELGFIQILHETNPNKTVSGSITDLQSNNSSYSTNKEQSNVDLDATQLVEIHNGDLCEADQTSNLHDDIEEEEGAVGGIVESVQPSDFCLKTHQGLDQIPTRLPLRTKSRSTTPNKVESGSS